MTSHNCQVNQEIVNNQKKIVLEVDQDKIILNQDQEQDQIQIKEMYYT